MLEQFLIFTKGGLVLWAWQDMKKLVYLNLIDSFIQKCLLDEESLESPSEFVSAGNSYTLAWTNQKNLGLVFVAVYKPFSQNSCSHDLVANVKKEFLKSYSPKKILYPEFAEVFDGIFRGGDGVQFENAVNGGEEQGEGQFENASKGREEQGDERYENTVKRREEQGEEQSENSSKREEEQGEILGGMNSNSMAVFQDVQVKHEIDENTDQVGHLDPKSCNNVDEQMGLINLQNCTVKIEIENDDAYPSAARGGASPAVVNRVHNLRPRAGRKHASPTPVNDVRRGKRIRGNGHFKSVADLLGNPKTENEFSSPNETTRVWNGRKSVINECSSVEKKIKVEDECDVDRSSSSKLDRSSSPRSSLPLSFRSITRKKIHHSDLESPLKMLKDNLIEKKLDEKVAEKLCESVLDSLEGKNFASFVRISSTVKAVMEETVMNILAHEPPIDILKDIRASKKQNKPYVIVFVGVSMIEKLNSITKVSYWLLQQNFSVMMASCDNTEAVEQLRANAEMLKVSFFENTSEKDPAIVAQKAIQAAKDNNTDVILVDGVGQSQENKDSIDSLSSVIDVNQPNLILYAGDVQAGEHSLGLLIELKRKMEECLSSSTFRIVDGMILTNFTGSVIKIGTAASMAFYLGAPVLFVSSGQSLKDLKKFNARSSTETFLS